MRGRTINCRRFSHGAPSGRRGRAPNARCPRDTSKVISREIFRRPPKRFSYYFSSHKRRNALSARVLLSTFPSCVGDYYGWLPFNHTRSDRITRNVRIAVDFVKVIITGRVRASDKARSSALRTGAPASVGEKYRLPGRTRLKPALTVDDRPGRFPELIRKTMNKYTSIRRRFTREIFIFYTSYSTSYAGCEWPARAASGRSPTGPTRYYLGRFIHVWTL